MSSQLVTKTRLVLLLAVLGLALPAFATNPIKIAFQAPDCYPSDPTYNATWCSNFQTVVLPNLSGIGVVVPWSSIDTCDANGYVSHGPCLPDNTCSSALHNCYNWAYIDNSLDAYINSTNITWSNGCKGVVSVSVACQIVLIVEPENDSGGDDTLTPGYVHSTQWASTLTTQLGHNVNPQDYTACGGWKGGSGRTNVFSGTPGSSDMVIWNVNQCSVLEGSNLTCACSGPSCGFTDFSGFPVVYEKPILIGYEDFLKALAQHYSSGGSGKGPEISSYIAYVRAGMAMGGENEPQCSMVGGLQGSIAWASSTHLPLGTVIQPNTSPNNPSNDLFVAFDGGTTGTTEPNWSLVSPGSYTGADGSITKWKNVGTKTSFAGAATWPGVNGQFGTSPQPGAFNENGYLAGWSTTSTAGYISAMTSFLAGLSASFPWDISSHYGALSDLTYVDPEAFIAASNGVGFGMQSLNVDDPVTYPLGVYPTTREDWADNFASFPSDSVHHLQLNAPGTTYWWAGYGISSITSSGGIATINCATDCSPFSGQYIYITGNSLYDGTWLVNCGGACSSGTLEFATSITGTGTGGDVWSPNYWPVTIPFATDHGATSLELWECDLDYAFNTITTTHSNADGPAGCPNWGLSGPSTDYQNEL
jgi:hypothetical protein